MFVEILTRIVDSYRRVISGKVNHDFEKPVTIFMVQRVSNLSVCAVNYLLYRIFERKLTILDRDRFFRNNDLSSKRSFYRIFIRWKEYNDESRGYETSLANVDVDLKD